MKDNEDYWFRAREYGFGAGIPLNWKGWAVLIALLIAIFGGQWLIVRVVPQHDWAIAVGLGVIFVGGPLGWLIWSKTEVRPEEDEEDE